MTREEIIIDAAASVHKDWCDSEYKAFFDRARALYLNGKTIKDALYGACFKGETKRNELWIDAPYMMFHESIANNCLNDFSDFMHLVTAGAIDIKRYTKRDVDDVEQGKVDYKKETKEENILLPFSNLSSASKRENLEAAISAYKVYEEFKKAGIKDIDLSTNEKIRNLIGIAIHTDWMKRNLKTAPENLMVSYDELDDFTKGQDLTVFDALLSVIKQHNLEISAEENFKLPDYLMEEQILLESIKSKKL